MKCALFNYKSCTAIVSCYSPINARDETDIITYNVLSFLVRHIPKHKVLIIDEGVNAHLGEDGNDKFCLYSLPNWNGEYLADIFLKNRKVCLNTKSKNIERKRWTYTHPNNSKALPDYVFINKKWINSVVNCEAYFSFDGVSFNHRIVSVKIRLSLRRKKKQTVKTSRYDWSPLTIVILEINVWLL